MKYVKPTSLTWWSGLIPLAAGLFIATVPMHGMADLADIVSSLFGEADPAILINSGLAIIGIRAAPGVANG